MADPEHLEIIERGVTVWNEWRAANPIVVPDLEEADLTNKNLSYINLNRAMLFQADFGTSKLTGADMSGADLRNVRIGRDLYYIIERFSHNYDVILSLEVAADGATFDGAYLDNALIHHARLKGASMRGTQLAGVSITESDLCGVDLSGADLSSATLMNVKLEQADFSHASLWNSHFISVDLSKVQRLETVNHRGPSDLSTSTLFLSRDKLPEVFLRGCGLPESVITYLPSLSQQAIEFYSCFISYTGRDQEFASRLHSRMREAELRVWFAPEDMKGGDKLYDQIDRAIQVHDRLLLVLSENSLKSRWVELEIRRARKTELREGRRKLFPIRLVSYEALQAWTCIDSATGEDLAEEVRSYFIPDFSNWKSHDDFERAFARLLADLKASA